MGRDATPAEADLPRFIDLSKEFNGKAATKPPKKKAAEATFFFGGLVGAFGRLFPDFG